MSYASHCPLFWKKRVRRGTCRASLGAMDSQGVLPLVCDFILKTTLEESIMIPVSQTRNWDPGLFKAAWFHRLQPVEEAGISFHSAVLHSGQCPWEPAQCPLTVHETPDVLSRCQSHTGKPPGLMTDRLCLILTTESIRSWSSLMSKFSYWNGSEKGAFDYLQKFNPQQETVQKKLQSNGLSADPPTLRRRQTHVCVKSQGCLKQFKHKSCGSYFRGHLGVGKKEGLFK